MSEFTFKSEHTGGLPIEDAVYQALGAASMCWEHPHAGGIFDSDRAKEIGEALLDAIRNKRRPWLGLATTRQLLDEVAARIDVSKTIGEEWTLDYRTVDHD